MSFYALEEQELGALEIKCSRNRFMLRKVCVGTYLNTNAFPKFQSGRNRARKLSGYSVTRGAVWQDTPKWV